MTLSNETTTLLPNTDLRVCRVCLGTGGVGSAQNQAESFALLDAYFEAGGNFIDTAHNYGDWDPKAGKSASERVIGAWMKDRGLRGKVVLATKGGHPYFDLPEIDRLSAQDIEKDLTESLAALQVGQIDLYWLHADEPARDVREVIDTLNLHARAGKVRHLGASNWSTSRIRAANTYAAESGQTGFVADQVLWNAADLARFPYGNPTVGFVNRERYDFHQETGMAMIPFQATAFGLFSRMHNGTLDQMNGGFREFYVAEESAARYHRMLRVAQDNGLSLTQVVLGYLTSQPFTTVPIVGSHTVGQVLDSIAAAPIVLSPTTVDFIDGGRKGSEITA